MMSKRDFDLIGHVLRAFRDADELGLDSEQHRSICSAFAIVFGQRYPCFDSESFFEVCRGVTEAPKYGGPSRA
jgi:hypothetical protein